MANFLPFERFGLFFPLFLGVHLSHSLSAILCFSAAITAFCIFLFFSMPLRATCKVNGSHLSKDIFLCLITSALTVGNVKSALPLRLKLIYSLVTARLSFTL